MTSQVSVETESASGGLPFWRNPEREPRERAEALIALMTLEEKIAQLAGVWVGADASGTGVAPHQEDMAHVAWEDVIRHGLGQLTRPFGTAPIDPAWLESVPSSGAMAVVTLAFRPTRDFWDSAFALAEPWSPAPPGWNSRCHWIGWRKFASVNI